MNVRLALCIAAFLAMAAPALAQQDDAVANTPVLNSSMRGLAPADEYFGRYNLSVLGIANNIRDAGTRIDTGGDVHVMLNGPLSFATDAIKSWEQQYPSDPWIARDLLALEAVYLRVPTDECHRLAAQTESWLRADYPDTIYAAQGRKQLADASPQAPPAYAPAPVVYAQPPVIYAQPPVVYTQPVVIYQQPVVYRRALPSYATPWQTYAAMRGYGR